MTTSGASSCSSSSGQLDDGWWFIRRDSSGRGAMMMQVAASGNVSMVSKPPPHPSPARALVAHNEDIDDRPVCCLLFVSEMFACLCFEQKLVTRSPPSSSPSRLLVLVASRAEYFRASEYQLRSCQSLKLCIHCLIHLKGNCRGQRRSSIQLLCEIPS